MTAATNKGRSLGVDSPFFARYAAMMDEPAGPTLMSETLQDAISFRKAMSQSASPRNSRSRC